MVCNKKLLEDLRLKDLNNNNTHLNIDRLSTRHFGKEWSRFQQDQESVELEENAKNYFSIFPWDKLPVDAIGFDMGCGSGRWARYVSPRVKKLICIDPSKEALKVARKNLKDFTNCEIQSGTANENNLKNSSMDFGYSLGVLHHVPDTLDALKSCSKKLKSGAPFLIYLYYKFDNRGLLFKLTWVFSNLLRLVTSRLPFSLKKTLTDLIALTVYLPLSKTSFFLEKLGFNVRNIPLSFYRNSKFYTMRTDALDRFGTYLEQRFTRSEIKIMMELSNFDKINFLENEPYWVCMGIKK